MYKKVLILSVWSFLLIGCDLSVNADSSCTSIYNIRYGDVPTPSIIDYNKKELADIEKNIRQCLKENFACLAISNIKSGSRIARYINLKTDKKYSPLKLKDNETIAFAAFQYKTSGDNLSACVIAGNTYTSAAPWMVRGWVIKDGKIIEVDKVIGYAPTTWAPSFDELRNRLLEGLQAEWSKAK